MAQKIIYDISRLITPDMEVYEGNPRPLFDQYSKIPSNKTNETRICLGTHTGTHIDAKRHVSNNAEVISDIPLDNCMGSARVIDVRECGRIITPEALKKYDIRKDDIILFKTINSDREYDGIFNKDFAYISFRAADYLVSLMIKAVGIDGLSVKKYGGDDNVHELLINNMVVYEGLNLKEVSEGEYYFIGLPIKLPLDGAPCRALLIRS